MLYIALNCPPKSFMKIVLFTFCAFTISLLAQVFCADDMHERKSPTDSWKYSSNIIINHNHADDTHRRKAPINPSQNIIINNNNRIDNDNYEIEYGPEEGADASAALGSSPSQTLGQDNSAIYGTMAINKGGPGAGAALGSSPFQALDEDNLIIADHHRSEKFSSGDHAERLNEDQKTARSAILKGLNPSEQDAVNEALAIVPLDHLATKFATNAKTLSRDTRVPRADIIRVLAEMPINRITDAFVNNATDFSEGLKSSNDKVKVIQKLGILKEELLQALQAVFDQDNSLLDQLAQLSASQRIDLISLHLQYMSPDSCSKKNIEELVKYYKEKRETTLTPEMLAKNK